MATKMKPEKKQHIQVFMRVRPLISQELRSQVVVECINSKEVSVKDKNQTKIFSFDKVFGPDSKQIDIYKAVVSPLISEVLQGYNCTVFAYGQTGTGKTFTMVGEKYDTSIGSWEQDPGCGIIPRTLSNLFDELKIRVDEFTVRVSFLELYNEELCDLLVPADNDDPKNLKLFEDSMKKGSVIVAGLEERTVLNKDDVYAILEAGNLRRQTAPTLMNAQSSRSHTIFTITVHIKVTTPEGEDLIKTGKLNLVDLAGSENIGRSGAVEMRAREAGSINQSLLTLGRVITALVERKPHIPYRESKLTRILQDSLGGRTKTSIIATVSPALCNIEETLSTFDYAIRAKNITNKPEINQKTSKRVLLKEYTEEIERLRRDLIATREKHGVYLASENYHAIMAERENLNKELVSKLQMLKIREDELIKQEDIMKNLNMNLYATQNELAATSQKLEEATKLCTEREDMLNELGMQTNVLIKTADEAVNDAKTLHERLAKSRQILEHNYFSAEKFKNNFCWNLNNMKTRTKEFQTKCVSEVDNLIETDKKFFSNLVNNQIELKEMTNKVVKETGDHIDSILEVIKSQSNSHQTFLYDQLVSLKATVDAHNENAHHIISNLFDFSLQMKSKTENLFEYLDMSKSMMEKLKSDCETLEERLTELTKLTLLLATLYTEKIKQKEDMLKSYEEKCSFLESKQLSIKKRIIDFGHAFLNMAQENLELLQNESECEDALKAVRSDRESKYEILFKDIKETSEKCAFDIQNNVEEMGKLKENFIDSVVELLKNSKEYILPTAKNILTIDHDRFDLIKNLMEASPEIEMKFTRLQELYENESKKLIQNSQNVENKARNIMINLKMFDSDVESKIDSQKMFVEDNSQDSTIREQNLSLEITRHAEELCSCILERLKEIETFFSEDIKKDEKTGSTPQRKEFNHPRRFMGFLKKGKLEDCAAKKKLIESSVESANDGPPGLQ